MDLPEYRVRAERESALLFCLLCQARTKKAQRNATASDHQTQPHLPSRIMEPQPLADRNSHQCNGNQQATEPYVKITAWATALLGVVGIGSLVLTYKALQETRTEFRSAQRAQMIWGNDQGISITLQTFSDKTRILMYVRNGGKNPAHDVVIRMLRMLAAPRMAIKARYIALKPAAGYFITGPTIGGGQPFNEYDTNDLDQPTVAAVRHGTRGLRVVGSIRYWDSLGSYCDPFAFNYFSDTNSFGPSFVPPQTAICDPNTPDGETFTFNSSEDITVSFNLRPGESLSPNQTQR